MSDAQSASAARTAWQRWRMGELSLVQRPASGTGSPVKTPQELAADAAAQAAREKQLLDQAREAARRDGLAQGKAEGKNIGLAEGREQGHAAGLAKAEADAQEQLQRKIHEVVEPLRALFSEFDAALKQLDQELAASLMDLALTAGRQLARRNLDLHPEHITALIRELLQQQALAGQPRLWLAPADLALVREHLGSELGAAGWQLRPDPSLTRGGCRLTSQSGELDATWETRCRALVLQYWPEGNAAEPAATDAASAAPAPPKPRARAKTSRKQAPPAEPAP
jgi:flagellar assembly protein FliH